MRRAVDVLKVGSWSPRNAVASLTLPFSDRHRRRFRMEDDQGDALLLDLPRATLLADGDGLVLENRELVAVRAAREEVLEISGRDPEHTARLAWHIGNRHVPLQVLPGGRLRILYDHVLEEMLSGLQGRVAQSFEPFDPEPGAYSGHGHSHG